MAHNTTIVRLPSAQTTDAAGEIREALPETLAHRYHSVRQASLAISAGLSPEDCTLQSMPDASPVKWHLAHTSWFFETFVLSPNLPRYQAFHPHFRVLF